MRSSNPRVRLVQEEYFEQIRQGMDEMEDSVVLYCSVQEVKSKAVGPETQVTYSKREQ